MTGDAHPLVEAYHAIYDVKDDNLTIEAVRILAFSALHSLADLMTRLDVPVPQRYDGEGRQP